MTTTLNDNYTRNLKIMAINLDRGMSFEQATSVINSMTKQFINANLYDDEAKQYIEAMTKLVNDKHNRVTVKDLAKSMGIAVVEVA